MASTDNLIERDEPPAVVMIDGEELTVEPGDELIGRITAQGLLVTGVRKVSLQ